jgi:YVTN family beta-propeller protein
MFPEDVVVTADGKIYVGHFDITEANPGSTVSVVYPGGYANEIPVGGGGHEFLAASPDGSRVYVTGAAGTIAAIDTNTDSVIGAPSTIGVRPLGVAVSPDGTRLYVTSGQELDSGDNFVTVLDTALIGSGADPVVATIPITVGQYPGGVVVSPDGSRAYVATVSGRSIAVIDTVTNTVVGNIDLGVDPFGFDVFPNDVAISPDGTKLYASASATTPLAVVDLTTNTVVRYSPRESSEAVAVSPDGSLAYLITFNDSSNSNKLWVVRTSDNELIDVVDIGSSSSGLAVSPDGSRIYVGDFINDSVTVVSLLPAMPSAL